jgi:hypothetical protein
VCTWQGGVAQGAGGGRREARSPVNLAPPKRTVKNCLTVGNANYGRATISDQYVLQLHVKKRIDSDLIIIPRCALASLRLEGRQRSIFLIKAGSFFLPKLGIL